MNMILNDFATFAQILQAVTGFGVFIIGLWAARVAVRQLRISATTDLFHRFNEPKVRDQRRWVYQNARELTNPDNLPSWANDPEALANLEAVCNTLDWAGLLVKKGLLTKKDAIDLYGDSLIRAWVALHQWIHHTRDRRSSPKWLWNHFEELALEAAKDERFHSWLSDGVPIYTQTAIITFGFEKSEVKSVDPLPQSMVVKKPRKTNKKVTS
jgi:hypothetical protein